MIGLQKIKRYQRVGLASCGMCLVAACASITDERTQVVSVETPFCQAAKCKLSNDEGDYYIKSTPDSVMINKSGGDLVMTCEKGDDKTTAVFESSANASMWGNILFGGIIGFAVDSGGAGYDYEARLINMLDCGDEPDPNDGQLQQYLEELNKKQVERTAGQNCSSMVRLAGQRLCGDGRPAG